MVELRLKESILTKLVTPNGPSVVDLSNEFNIPLSTLYLWVSKMNKNNQDKKPETSSVTAGSRSAEYKLQAICDTASMTPEERSAYCRQHGLFMKNIDEWKQQLLVKLEPKDIKAQKAAQQLAEKESKKLKKELLRKDKALAEISALLILKKKADLLWGTISEED